MYEKNIKIVSFFLLIFDSENFSPDFLANNITFTFRIPNYPIKIESQNTPVGSNYFVHIGHLSTIYFISILG